MLDEFIKELSDDMEFIEPIKPDMPGVYTLPLDEDLSITISQNEMQIAFYSEVDKCPTIKREEFLDEMMWANLFGQGTEGAWLGLTDDANKITMNNLIDINCSYDEFADALEDFINAVDHWKEQAKTFK